MTTLEIIHAPFNLGLKAVSPGHIPGVDKLPGALLKHGFHAIINPAEIIIVESPDYQSDIDPQSGIRNADQIVKYSKQLSVAVHTSVNEGHFPLVIGGDCSILIGCSHALKQLGRFGLFFIDGHTDYMPLSLSATKAAAGMDLSIATGNGHKKLTDINGLSPYIREEDALAFGNRCYDAAYVQQILDSAIEYFDLDAIRSKGIPAILDHFIKKQQQNTCKGFWIHLDVDVLDDEWMPCVDSRQTGGLQYAELKQVLQMLLQHKLVIGIDITILDPDLDPEGKYTQQFVNEIAPLFSR